MPTAEQLQGELLEQAIADIQAVAKNWTDQYVERPVVFLVDCSDKWGKKFVEAYIPPEEEYKAKAQRDGGMRQRWCVAGLVDAESRFNRIQGYKYMPQLLAALERLITPVTLDAQRKRA